MAWLTSSSSAPAQSQPATLCSKRNLQVGGNGTAAQMTEASPLTSSDGVLAFSGFCLTLLVSYLLGYRRIFWEDELLGWMLLRDPSWHHMIYAWKMGADGGGFTFYLTGRLWFWIFGPSEISFRMYSAAAFGIAFCAMWIALRRFYGRIAVAFALFNTWFFSQTIVTHMAEGRFYGLLMLLTALAVLLVIEATARRIALPALCVCCFIVHGALVTTHLLGIVYSATTLGALIFLDRSHGRLRWWLYATIASSWLLLLLQRSAILASAQVGKPYFWTSQPNLSRWVGAYTAYSAEIAIVLAVLGATTILTLLQDRGGWRIFVGNAYASRRPAYVVTLALLLVPIEFFFEGWFGPSLFVNRYLIPVAIGQCFLTAEAIQLTNWDMVLGGLGERFWFRGVAASCFIAGLLLWDVGHLSKTLMPRKNYTDALTRDLPKGIPVLCEDAWTFTDLIARQHDSGVRYTYLLDWAQSTSASAPRLEVTQFHLIENWKRVGYFAGSIEYRDRFLERYPRFLIFHEEHGQETVSPPFIGNPLLKRFEGDPEYQVIPYRTAGVPANRDLWLVCRASCQS